MLMYLIVTLYYYWNYQHPKKNSIVFIRVKKIFVILYSHWKCCIMIEWTLMEHMCDITIYLNTTSQYMHNKILYNLFFNTLIFIINDLINTCCWITHPQFLNRFICVLYSQFLVLNCIFLKIYIYLFQPYQQLIL